MPSMKYLLQSPSLSPPPLHSLPQSLDSSIAVQLSQTQQQFPHHLPGTLGAPHQNCQHHPIDGTIILIKEIPGTSRQTLGMSQETPGMSPEMSPGTHGILHLSVSQIQMIRHLSPVHQSEEEISQKMFAIPPH